MTIQKDVVTIEKFLLRLNPGSSPSHQTKEIGGSPEFKFLSMAQSEMDGVRGRAIILS